MSDQHIQHLRTFRQVVTSKRDALDGLIAEIDQTLRTYEDQEPWCNHDSAAVRNGVCECGQAIREDQQDNRGERS